jgi:uncharacterized protein YecE (DUF72 family)
MQPWIGTSGYQYPEWKGSFYPEKLSASKMLSFYAERFATTEINYSFRQIPSTKAIQNWAASTPPRFKFSFKAPQKVTHFARLRDCADTLKFFGSVISELGDKLGTVLFQLPPGFKCDVPLLRAFLNDLPAKMGAAFEFRQASWFNDETFDVLREHNAALCIAETEEFATPAIQTADFGYLRLRRLDYSPSDIRRWAEFVQSHNRNWREALIYFKHEETALGPKFASQMLNALESVS